MSLDHVCKWTENGWVRTSAESCKNEFYRTVHAYEHKLVCELCGKNVTFVYGSKRIPHFRHEVSDQNHCPDYTVSDRQKDALKRKFSLPIKLIFTSSQAIEFKIGFPIGCINWENDGKIYIERKSKSSKIYTYLSEKLDKSKMTYLTVGSVPAEKYLIKDFGSILKKNCPREIEGIKTTGTLFDKETGKKLMPDADVVVNHTYWLIRRKGSEFSYTFTDALSVNRIIDDRYGWCVYEIMATQFSEDAASFFLNYHARLTKAPVKLYPIWPACVQKPYEVLCKEKDLFFFLSGSYAKLISDYSATEMTSDSADSEVVKVLCDGRQKTAFASRFNVLQYIFYNQNNLSEFANRLKTEVAVLDDNNQVIESGEQKGLPFKNVVTVKMKYDGFAELTDLNGVLISRERVKADQKIRIENIRFGCQIKIYCGNDCIWQASYQRRRQAKYTNASSDRDLLIQLASYKKDMVPVPISIGAMALGFKNDPALCRWLAVQLHNGKISKKALNILQSEVLKGERG
ncbi:hypothetical protein [Pseudoramibacter porci]|uniref:Competence protein n=1 Tax=Pseudoramibacter porci TaxID=2606631 RepID=A0A7X2TAP6_9FIRM|nr:hypothetical protein [Pseudoramibacter porci]MSS20335.1 hypothetical protein [Pseudoramibacter porci]